MPRLSDDPQERTREERCLADIAQHDLHVLRVHGDDAWPEFTYSVGLYPTTAGIWPWDANASDSFRAAQPVLETTPLPDWARSAS